MRPRPLVEVAVIRPADTRVRLAHVDQGADDTIFSENALAKHYAALTPEERFVDQGADDTIFSEALAVQIGLDLTHAPRGRGSVVGGHKIPLRYAEVTLRITDGREQREWGARVGFIPAPLSYPLLGFAGFLQFFDALFRGGQEDFELTVNSLYPGT